MSRYFAPGDAVLAAHGNLHPYLTHLKLMNSPYRGTARRARRAQHQRRATPPALVLLAVFLLLVGVILSISACGEAAITTSSVVLQAQRAIARQRIDVDPTVPLDAEMPQ